MVRWQRQYGRHHLPWQNTQDPYRVWLSEIMLQQTQVATVRDYFARFVTRFPDVQSLAAASLDEVLGLWSGLGYYSRARNLHQCAQQVVALHAGRFPRQAQQLERLPGIGRSTAAAIAALCFGERVAILDANVKRVLTRALAFDGDLAQAAAQRALWAVAADLLPLPERAAEHMAAYTQGMMDLGAGVCLPRNPACSACPLQDCCAAAQQGQPERFPVHTRKLKRSSQSLWLLWLQSQQGAVFLQQRPTPGVWAGLYCMPLFDSEDALRQALPREWQEVLQAQPVFTHVLTHKDLHLHPWRLELPQQSLHLPDGRWVDVQEWPKLGLPAPIRKLLQAA